MKTTGHPKSLQYWAVRRNNEGFPGIVPETKSPRAVRQEDTHHEIMQVEFVGEIWYWRGPAPHYFITVLARQCDDLREISELVTYGWGMIPATVRIGKTEWTTSLFPKDGGYIVPIKATVRKAEDLDEGDKVTVQIRVSI